MSTASKRSDDSPRSPTESAHNSPGHSPEVPRVGLSSSKVTSELNKFVFDLFAKDIELEKRDMVQHLLLAYPVLSSQLDLISALNVAFNCRTQADVYYWRMIRCVTCKSLYPLVFQFSTPCTLFHFCFISYATYASISFFFVSLLTSVQQFV